MKKEFFLTLLAERARLFNKLPKIRNYHPIHD